MSNAIVKSEINQATWSLVRQMANDMAVANNEKAKIAQRLLFCLENDLPLSLAVNGGLYVVNNRVEVEGNVIRAKIKSHPNYNYKIMRLDDTGCTLQAIEDGEIIGEVTFEEEHARRAGLLTKDNWKYYPADLYLNRATSRLYKRFMPDLFFAPVYIHGEIERADVVDTYVIEGELADGDIPTLQELIDEFGAAEVLQATQELGSENPLRIRTHLGGS